MKLIIITLRLRRFGARRNSVLAAVVSALVHARSEINWVPVREMVPCGLVSNVR